MGITVETTFSGGVSTTLSVPSAGVTQAALDAATQQAIDHADVVVADAIAGEVARADGVYAGLTPSGLERLSLQRRAALLPYWSARAGRAAAPANIYVIGHSFVEGVQAAGWDRLFGSYLRDAERSKYPTPGVAGGIGYVPATNFAATFSDDKRSISGTGKSNNFGLGRRAWQGSTTGHHILIGNSTGGQGVPITGADILFSRSTSTGTMIYAVDASYTTGTTVSTTGASTTGGNIQAIRGLDGGMHYIDTGWSSGGAVVIEGWMLYNGDESKGIRMYQGGKGSQQSPYFVDPASPHWIDLMTRPEHVPHLVVITMMCNDFGGDYTPIASATTKANLQALITNIRTAAGVAGSGTPSFVICSEYQRSNASNCIEPWSNYLAAAQSIADTDTGGVDGMSGVLHYRMGLRFGEGPFVGGAGSLGMVNADGTHPSGASGYQFWAESLSDYLRAG